ncbi:DUF1667 domain-containing protein [Vagococcus acidifermentans]|uniref:Molybdopterin oxidoreductase n=1 Tax=Vagococcus acidifermentans TaxID=564710 RepID=A0A430B0E4_9ENTE|nr:DUF1667 domain-containing protein [Vagococcus acidifermentans]RSU13795.1 molybdopterin oxidoreductase [Vagococcus acidifermentans]
MAELICIVCPIGCHLTVDEANDYKVTGNRCKKGEAYGKQELQNPVRTITSTVRLNAAELTRLPVKTSDTIPKGKMSDIMTVINHTEVTAPIEAGDVIISNVLDTGVDVIATRTIKKAI